MGADAPSLRGKAATDSLLVDNECKRFRQQEESRRELDDGGTQGEHASRPAARSPHELPWKSCHTVVIGER